MQLVKSDNNTSKFGPCEDNITFLSHEEKAYKSYRIKCFENLKMHVVLCNEQG